MTVVAELTKTLNIRRHEAFSRISEWPALTLVPDMSWKSHWSFSVIRYSLQTNGKRNSATEFFCIIPPNTPGQPSKKGQSG